MFTLEALGIDGFCCVLTKPPGPVHAKDVPISVLPIKFKVCPVQTSTPPAVAVGVGFTMIVAEASTSEPHGLVTVTVYSVVLNGLTVMAWVVSPPGDHEYVYGPPPVGWAVRVLLSPAQIVETLADTSTVNASSTITSTLALLMHPPADTVTL